MLPPRSRAVTVIRVLPGATLALYTMVVVLLVLTIVFPHWGEDPHTVGPRNGELDIYLPPQFFAAVFVLLGVFGLAALAGVVAAARSRAAQRSAWAVALWVLTGLALQGAVFLAIVVYGHPTVGPDPQLRSVFATMWIVSLAISLLAFLVLPVAVLVATGDAGSLGRAAGG